MSRRSRRGITVTEMVIAIGIIMMLLALIVPGLENARRAARSANCQSNLHLCGEAFAQYYLYKNRRDDPWASAWMTKLGPYLEYTSKTFVCPAGYAEAASQDSAVVRVIKAATTDRTNQWLPAGHEVPLEPGSARCRIAEKQQHQSYATTPGSYVLEVELTETWDWDDIVLLIEPQQDGTVRATIKKFGNEYELALVNPDGSMAMTGINKNSSTGRSCTLRGLSSRISYGMNSAVNRLGDDGHKIIMLDYNQLVADVVGAGAEDIVVWPEKIAPRHLGECNVLFMNGAVKEMRPDTFTPVLPINHDRYWKPKDEPALHVP